MQASLFRKEKILRNVMKTVDKATKWCFLNGFVQCLVVRNFSFEQEEIFDVLTNRFFSMNMNCLLLELFGKPVEFEVLLYEVLYKQFCSSHANCGALPFPELDSPYKLISSPTSS